MEPLTHPVARQDARGGVFCPEPVYSPLHAVTPPAELVKNLTK
jgi:hypothetical protein